MAKSGKLAVANTFVADGEALGGPAVGFFGAQSPQIGLNQSNTLAQRVDSLEQLLNTYGLADVTGTPPSTLISWGDIGGVLSNQTDLQDALTTAQLTSIQANGGAAAAFATINFAGTGVSRSGNTISIDIPSITAGNGARVRMASPQTIVGGGSFVGVGFTNNDFSDVSGMADAPFMVVPAGASRVIITAQLLIQQSRGGHVSSRIDRNGGSTFNGFPRFTTFSSVSSGTVMHTHNLSSGVLNVSPGQVYRCAVSNPTAGAVQVQAGSWMNLVVLR